MKPDTRSKRTQSIASSLRELLQNESIPYKDRASIATFEVVEHGVDTIEPLSEIIAQADAGRASQASEHSVCVSECLIRKGDHYALVTLDHKDARVSADDSLLKELEVGDRVWVDTQLNRIVGRDGELPTRGDIAIVESKPPDHPGQVIVKYHERLEVARLPQWMINDPQLYKPGDEVVYDPRTRFVERPIRSSAEPSELAADIDSLKKVEKDDLGALKPELSELLERIECMIQYPEWFERMRAEPRLGYLLSGPTGTGKSFSAAFVVTQFHKMIASLIGRAISRTVVADASEFWSPYFGETEQRITRWVKRLQEFASQPVLTADGREIYPPVIVLLEECEALFRSRSAHDSSGHLFDRPLALLLAKLDSSENALRSPIIWLCTSNRPDLADSAALRRIGSRQLTFGHLRLSEAVAVLQKTISPDLPLETSRERLIQTVVGYLFGQSPPQGLVEIQMSNSQHRTLARRDLVTPAVLNEAVSWGKDRALRRSARAGSLLGLDADDIVLYLRRHYRSLCRNLQPHNVAEYAPYLVAGQSLHVTGVVALQHTQRPSVQLMN